MRDTSSLHQKVQEMCDCYATTDPLKEMSKIQQEGDETEAATKWLALAVLHGLNNNAEEISIEHSQDGQVKVVAEYRRSDLPSPGADISSKIFDMSKQIIHADSSQSESMLAFGVKDSSMELKMLTREEGGSNKVTIKFP